MIHRDVLHAFPVFKRTLVALIARPAWQPSLDDNILAAERSITIAAGRAENRHDRRSGGGREVHRTCVASNKQASLLAKGDKFFKIGRNLPDAIACRADQLKDHPFFSGSPRDGYRETIFHKAPCEFPVA